VSCFSLVDAQMSNEETDNDSKNTQQQQQQQQTTTTTKIREGETKKQQNNHQCQKPISIQIKEEEERTSTPLMHKRCGLGEVMLPCTPTFFNV
jgi:hypothetical protein